MLPITRFVFNRRPSFFSLKSIPPAPCTTCRSTVAMIGIIYLFFFFFGHLVNLKMCVQGGRFFVEEWVCRLAFINI